MRNRRRFWRSGPGNMSQIAQGNAASDKRENTANDVRNGDVLFKQACREDGAEDASEAADALSDADIGSLFMRGSELRNHSENRRAGEAGADGENTKANKQK